jgi:hypothetical protein
MLRGEAPVRFGPGNALVKVNQVALVDAGRRGVDDDEHFRRKILASPVKNDARHRDIARILGMRVHEKLQRRQPMLAVNDQKFLARLLQLSDAGAIRPGLEMSFCGVNSSTVPGMGGWEMAVS